MTLWHWLRHPNQKPPVTADLDDRLDRAERRLERVLSPEAASRARTIVRQGR